MRRSAAAMVALVGWLCSAPAPGAEAGEAVYLPGEEQAEFTARQITNMLHRAAAGERLDFSNRNLNYLDLAGLDFKGAVLTRSNLYGTDLTGAKLTGADLSAARLDRAVLIRADLSGATLTGATIFRPTVYSDMANNYADAPKFAGAKLERIRVQADMSGADFRGADLSQSNFSPLEARPGQGTLVTMPRNVLKSCDFSGARLVEADFTRANLMFARFTGADARGAKFLAADLSRVDFSGADVTGADFSGADFDGAILTGLKGLNEAKGLETAINLDRAQR